MSGLTGTGAMVRLILRRDRIRLPVWILAIVVIVLATANAVQGIYPTAHDRAVYAATVGDNPTAILLSGPPVALHTMGGVTVFEVSFTAYIAVVLMAIFLVVRHTRTEEATGRTELLRATRLGRHAGLAAAVIVVSGASLLVGALIGLGLVAMGLPAGGSWVFGAALAMTGIVFTGINAAVAQVTENPRTALGLSGVILAVSWVLRGIGDAGNGVASWFSPVGWAQAVHAYGADRWWPLLLSCAGVGVCLWLAVWLSERRDVGAGLLAPRLGSATAAPGLSNAFGLAARLQRTSIIWWSIGIFAGAAFVGAFSNTVKNMIEERPDLADIFATNSGNLVDGYYASMALILAIVASGFAVSSALRLRSEETAGRAEVLLAGPLSRGRWVIDTLTVTFVGTVLVLLAGGIGLGLANLAVTGNASELPTLIGASMAYLPALWLLTGLTVLLAGWVPRAVLVVWAVLAGCFVVNYLGDILEFPQWLMNASPFTHVPGLPAATMTWWPLVVMTALAAFLGWMGVTGVRRRDLTTN